MSEFSEILTILLSVESPKEYAGHFEKENVVDVAKKVCDAVNSLRKMSKLRQRQKNKSLQSLATLVSFLVAGNRLELSTFGL